MTFLPVHISKDILLKPKSQNWSWDWWRFQKAEGQTFSDSDRLQYIYEGSNKTRFQKSKNSREVLLFILAIQGHTGGNVIAPELVGHVAIPHICKEFLGHRGCSYDVQSTLRSGPIAGGRESTGRRTIHFSSHSETIQTKKKAALTSPSQEKYIIKVSGKLIVPADCISKVISQIGERTLPARLSTPRPAPKMIAAARTARHVGECVFWHQETGAKRWTRYPNREPELRGVRKLMRSTESLVEKKRAWI